MIWWLKMIVAGAGILACLGWVVRLKSQPRKWDGCLYKPPGFHREKWRPKRNVRGNKPSTGK